MQLTILVTVKLLSRRLVFLTTHLYSNAETFFSDFSLLTSISLLMKVFLRWQVYVRVRFPFLNPVWNAKLLLRAWRKIRREYFLVFEWRVALTRISVRLASCIAILMAF